MAISSHGVGHWPTSCGAAAQTPMLTSVTLTISEIAGGRATETPA